MKRFAVGLMGVFFLDTKRQMDYNPTAGGDGLQSYFTSMLVDSDRNRMCSLAIQKAIAAFITTEGRRPTVLDAGCGTGF